MSQRDALQCSGPAGSESNSWPEKVNAQKRKDEQSSTTTGRSPKTQTAVQSAASKTTPPSSTATSGGGGEKRKHTGTPLSSEPAGKLKRSYVDSVGSKGTGSGLKSDDHIQILWVHSSTVDKGDLPEGHFHQVISRCNKIKIDGINNGEVEHMWSPSMHVGNLSMMKPKKRGKIICLNKQTADHWVKWIPIAANLVGTIPCKAWTSQEYAIKLVCYSCLIPKFSVMDIDVGDLIKACLNMYGIKNMKGVINCHTSHTVKHSQRICNLEVTEELADIFESNSRILSGPTGQLTFCLRSGDEGGVGCEDGATEVLVEGEDVPSPHQFQPFKWSWTKQLICH